jgi:protein-S-isoprenylcysteine O-methyltransferase Ste14
MIFIFISVIIICLSWIFLILFILLLIHLIIAVRAEEKYCLEKYGEKYQKYLEKTPRWIGIPKN